ncbi:hypothetical protein DFJ43DRAFT_1138384 [Lentinula guzmanii]|uniref:Uncharacterized protein n=3 Tax=Lentinula TaxID=5352 RepID=A0AA38JHX3_9AGAR|nr:hypothetical protein DFJ43DRAFT_1138384 [Lentinula guzmanii]KAJ3781584.1 hypothetical protein GGU10DRAFT_379387 [Lentinula aff. detonsa]KAJ3794484.1 hypothetical protein GGU11DRAFT_759123 [Lentinula aff. detonsa]KAJ3982663.1 hypothetical protein F5890DRAFT_1587371 [Lentinula detonsa]
MASSNNDTQQMLLKTDESDNLGISWEIGVIIGIIIIILAIVAAAIFQRRRRRRLALLLAEDLEKTQDRRDSTHAPFTRSLSATLNESHEPRKSTKDVPGLFASTISKPLPSASSALSSKRSSRMEYYAEQPSKTPPPPNYYWDHRS